MTSRIIQTCQKFSASIWSTVESLPAAEIVDTTVVIGEKRRPDQFRGFGGAFTESSAYVWSRLSADKQQQVLKSYFDADHGIGYTFGRTHMNSCDFSLDNYSAVDIPGDKKLWSFSCAREKQYLWPFIHAAYEAAGTELPLLLSPWSPPAWMKSNQSMNNGGALLPEYRSAWAVYFARYITELRDNGINVFGVTVQNEPEATQTWDSCRYSAVDEAMFIRDYLGPLLASRGMQDVGIYFWDHNRDEMFHRAVSVLADPETAQYITGQAIHWYSGDQFDLVEKTKQTYPDKEIIFSEGCIEGGVKLGQWDRGEIYAHNIIGDLNAGVTLWLDWNMLLDMQGGPNHVGNYCDAPVIADLDTDTVHYQSSYAYIGHFSRYIHAGAVCLSCELSDSATELKVAVFQNPDNSIVCVILNRTNADTSAALQVEKTSHSVKVAIPARSITTVTILE